MCGVCGYSWCLGQFATVALDLKVTGTADVILLGLMGFAFLFSMATHDILVMALLPLFV